MGQNSDPGLTLVTAMVKGKAGWAPSNQCLSPPCVAFLVSLGGLLVLKHE